MFWSGNAFLLYKLLRLFIVITYFHASYLTTDRLWKLGDKLDGTRVLVRGRYLLDVTLKFLFQLITCGIVLCKNYGGLDDLTPDRIRNTCDSTFEYSRICLLYTSDAADE